MNKLLTRGGIEIIAVFIGISGGLWSEKQIEHRKTLQSENTALVSIRESLVADSTNLYWIVNSIEKEQKNVQTLLKHISNDTLLSLKTLNNTIWDLLYFSYLVQDRSIYESLIKNAGKKIIQVDSVSKAISYIYEGTYMHLDNMFDIQKDMLAIKTYDIFIESGGYLDTKRFSITESLNQDQKKMFNELFNNKKFISQLTFHYDTNFFVKRQYKKALAQVQYTINTIDNYLN